MPIQAIILLGAPGAGKGTIADDVCRETGYIHFSTGDMLRAAIKQGAPVGRQAEQYINRGALVPDNLIIEIVMQRIDSGGAAKYVFDGFPRTLDQARLLDAEFKKRGASLNRAILLEVAKEVVLQRLTGRRVCRNCGANFHVHNIPPKKSGICDHCGGALEQRPDDMEATILHRLEVFQQQTAALIAYYKSRGILARVDSSRPRKQTAADVMKLLEPPPASSAG
ncbi:MAG: adenylate kinase [Kiritimatiellae bacterium]|nr:adenylate kinase [Kiritimatiellia bacterium]